MRCAFSRAELQRLLTARGSITEYPVTGEGDGRRDEHETSSVNHQDDGWSRRRHSRALRSPEIGITPSS